MDRQEAFLSQGDEGLGNSIEIVEGEESLIRDGLLEKTREDLIEMAKNNPNYKENLSKEQLVDLLTADLSKGK